MVEWCQRLRVDWDVACYGRGFGDILKGLPGRAVRRVNGTPSAAARPPLQWDRTVPYRSDANERWCF